MRHTLHGKSTWTKAGAMAAAAALTLGLAACGDDGAEEAPGTEASTESPATEADATEADAPADDAEAGASSSEEAPEGEPYTMTQGSTTVTVSPGQSIPLNEIMTVTWNSEGHSSCGTMVTLVTPDDLLLRYDGDAGCTGEFSESLQESLGAIAGTWTLTLMGTPDGEIEVPIEVS